MKSKSESESKRKRGQEPIPEIHLEEEGEVRPERITQTLQDNYMPYAMSVIVSRALPEIDGLKPSHRKLLYTMYLMKLLHSKRTKSANVVGQTMKLNPHGDQTIYETMVRLTRGNEALLHPYIDSKGNFGKQYSSEMAYAAPRYTEVRLDDFAAELFDGIDMNMVDFVDNYDSTMREPVLLPATFPAILVNANQGIAVGMASNIASFNLAEVCDACIAHLKNPGCDLLKYMPAPDFPGGGELIYEPEKMRAIYETGSGGFSLQARYRVHKKEQLIEIYEIPYTSSIEGIINEISNLVKDGKIREINDVRDETDLSGLRISIDYKRQTDPELLMDKLFDQCGLRSRFSCNFNILVHGQPRVMGIAEIFDAWIEFRRSCLERRFRFESERLAHKLKLLQGLAMILLDIDAAISIIRETEKEADVVPNLMAGFKIDEEQAEYVAEIKLRHINREYILRRCAEIESIEARLAEIDEILNDQSKLDDVMIAELKRVKKSYGRERRTLLIDASSIQTIEKEDMIEDFNLKLFLTREGYLKKLALTSLRSAGDLKLKEGDEIVQTLESSNKQELLLFSDRAKLYKLRLYEINDDKPSDWGTYLSNLLELERDEKILYMTIAGDYEGEMVFAYANGRVSRVDVKSYETVQNRRKLVKVCSDRFPIVGIDRIEADELGDEEFNYVLISNQNRALVFDIHLVDKKATRSNHGSLVMRMQSKYSVCS
ncbi:MAG: DNA topoisomerase (ATP-hydrolyzing) subunit A, partial [Eubacteriales bacterium]|nr:DNA topoisomerase (ATP-hydrolyzing) subunit A [Eubacteriales bacterium]